MFDNVIGPERGPRVIELVLAALVVVALALQLVGNWLVLSGAVDAFRSGPPESGARAEAPPGR